MLLTPFSFCFFQLGIFVDVKTFHDFQFVLDTPPWKLLSVSISGMSILFVN